MRPVSTYAAPGATILAESSVAARVINAYMYLHARQYLKHVLADVVQDVCASGQDYEVHPHGQTVTQT